MKNFAIVTSVSYSELNICWGEHNPWTDLSSCTLLMRPVEKLLLALSPGGAPDGDCRPAPVLPLKIALAEHYFDSEMMPWHKLFYITKNYYDSISNYKFLVVSLTELLAFSSLASRLSEGTVRRRWPETEIKIKQFQARRPALTIGSLAAWQPGNSIPTRFLIHILWIKFLT